MKRLLRQLKKIDKRAYEYVMERKGNFKKHMKKLSPKDILSDLFIWETSDQGREYWLQIHQQLEDK